MIGNNLKIFSKAMSTPEALHWREAISINIESIIQNHIWELVDLPLENKPIRN